MVSFSNLDLLIIFGFFAIVLLIGFLSGKKKEQNAEEYLLSGRRVGLFLFVLTTVSTWYGGILGVGEFTYRYGVLNWVTQGLPYYIFAFLFALFFAKKIRNASLITISDKLHLVYGRKVGIVSSVLIFILVSPAPYLLMFANLLSIIFNINLLSALIISFILSASYLYFAGYKGDILTDAFEFFVMFGGFIVIVFIAFSQFGGFDFLKTNLPPEHLTPLGGSSVSYVVVWFLIAIWTFIDPGFHQRCYSAKNGNVAVKGILISIILWAFFDFLTTSTGLYSKAILPDLDNPALAFPMLAEKILGPGLKGIFYAGMLATVLSTLNSFMFLSATTFGNDFLNRIKEKPSTSKLKSYTQIGLTVTGIISIIFAFLLPSVIELWYTIGTICIPGLILPVIGSYYSRIKISDKLTLLEIISGFLFSGIFYFIKTFNRDIVIFQIIEPMLVGLAISILVHLYGLMSKAK